MSVADASNYSTGYDENVNLLIMGCGNYEYFVAKSLRIYETHMAFTFSIVCMSWFWRHKRVLSFYQKRSHRCTKK